MQKEKDLRKLFLNYLKNENKDVVFNEVGLMGGEAIVDVLAVGNNQLQGFELKSEADTLSRLPKQIVTYNKCLDQISLVVDPNKLEKALIIIPDWWGVYSLNENRTEIVLIREPQNNPKLTISNQMKLLWKEDLVLFIEVFDLPKKIKRLRKSLIRTHLKANFSEEVIHDFIINVYKKRKYEKSL